MTSDRSSSVAYRTRPSGQVKLIQIVAAGYSGINTVAGIVGALEGAAAISSASLATRWSVWTLPVSTFLLGVSITGGNDVKKKEEKEKLLTARRLILMAGWDDAIDIHKSLFPNSKILDENSVTGLKVLDDPKYVNISASYEAIHSKWWKRLEKDLEKWVTRSKFPTESNFFTIDFNDGPHVPWEQFVRVRFNEISRDYQQLFRVTEMI